jgi:DNA-binding transcriptional LysR family regulator
MGPDFNLLVTLDVLLNEGSVARAARRLRLSPSAMSRALARLRDTVGDPLLVRAGRTLVPTPRALELRAEIGPLVDSARAVLRPAQGFDPSSVVRTFTLRCSEGFAETFGPALIARVSEEAPHAILHFLAKADKDSAHLREGDVDLETGLVNEKTGPELKAQALFRDRLVGVVRAGHPLTKGRMTATRYARSGHVLVARSGMKSGQIDNALRSLGLERKIVTIVSGFATALSLARTTDLLAAVPERHTAGLREGLVSLPLPVQLPAMTVFMLWHPRMEADPAHRWLRHCVRDICGTAL